MKRIIAVLSAVLALAQVQAQEVTQTVRGRIIDQDSRTTLIGANVLVIGSDPILGSSTDMDGSFRIENVPVGRANLKITYLGYEEKSSPT